MSELERLELVLRRMIARRKRDHTNGGPYNIDVEDMLAELADELALADRAKK